VLPTGDPASGIRPTGRDAALPGLVGGAVPAGAGGFVRLVRLRSREGTLGRTPFSSPPLESPPPPPPRRWLLRRPPARPAPRRGPLQWCKIPASGQHPPHGGAGLTFASRPCLRPADPAARRFFGGEGFLRWISFRTT